MADRQPIVRLHAPNDMWSAGFLFDRIAKGRALTPGDRRRCDDRSCGGCAGPSPGRPATRVLDGFFHARVAPVLRTVNGPECCDRAMLRWAHERGSHWGLIDPSKTTSNAYAESFNRRFCDKCLNSTGSRACRIPKPHRALTACGPDEERPEKGIGGLTARGLRAAN